MLYIYIWFLIETGNRTVSHMAHQTKQRVALHYLLGHRAVCSQHIFRAVSMKWWAAITAGQTSVSEHHRTLKLVVGQLYTINVCASNGSMSRWTRWTSLKRLPNKSTDTHTQTQYMPREAAHPPLPKSTFTFDWHSICWNIVCDIVCCSSFFFSYFPFKLYIQSALLANV